METRRDANLLPLDLLDREEAAKLWVQCARRPADHPLHGLAQPCGWPIRLRLGGGFRTNWREVDQDDLVGLPSGWRPDPWPPPEALPIPREDPPDTVFLLAGATVGRDRPPEERGALAYLDRIRNEYPPDVEVYTDGSAAAGVRNGIGGVLIKWADGTPARRDCKAAGALTSSTTAEAVGAEQADRAAAAARSFPQEGVALTIGAVATFLRKQSEELWRRRYRADPQATPIRLTDGTPL